MYTFFFLKASSTSKHGFEFSLWCMGGVEFFGFLSESVVVGISERPEFLSLLDGEFGVFSVFVESEYVLVSE